MCVTQLQMRRSGPLPIKGEVVVGAFPVGKPIVEFLVFCGIVSPSGFVAVGVWPSESREEHDLRHVRFRFQVLDILSQNR